MPAQRHVQSRKRRKDNSLSDNPLATSGTSQPSFVAGVPAPSCPANSFNPSGRAVSVAGYDFPVLRCTMIEMRGYVAPILNLGAKDLQDLLMHRLLRVSALSRVAVNTARKINRGVDLGAEERDTLMSIFAEIQLFCRSLLPTLLGPQFSCSGKTKTILSAVCASWNNAMWQRSIDVARWSPATSVHSDYARSDFDDREFDADFTSIESKPNLIAPTDIPVLTIGQLLNSSAPACRALEEAVTVTIKAKGSFERHGPELAPSSRRLVRDTISRHIVAFMVFAAFCALLLVALGIWSLVDPDRFDAKYFSVISLCAIPLPVLVGMLSLLFKAPAAVFDTTLEEIIASFAHSEVHDDGELKILLSTVAQLGPTLCVPVPRVAWDVLETQGYPVDRLDALLLPVNGTVLFPKLGESLFNRESRSQTDLNEFVRHEPDLSEPFVVPHPTIAMMLTLKSGEIVYVTDSLCDFFVDATPDNFLRREIGDVLFLDQWNTDESRVPILCKRIDEIKPLDPSLQLHPDVYCTDAMVTPLFGMLRAKDPNAEGPADEVIDLDSGIQVPFIGTTLSFYIHRRVKTKADMKESSPLVVKESPREPPTTESVPTTLSSATSEHLLRNHVLACLGRQSTQAKARDVTRLLVNAPTNGGRRERLGSGGFSTVFKLSIGDHARRTDVIVKSIPLFGAQDEQKRDPSVSPTDHRAMLIRQRTSEFEVDPEQMLLLDHPYLVHSYHSEVIFSPPELRLDVYQEFCEGGTVRGLLNAGLPSGQDVVDIARSVLQALAHLHKNRIAHRDVKPENIMIRCGCFKLGDFGTAILLMDGEGAPETRGTLGYMAPEMHMNEPYTTAVDIFSFGCLMVELLGLKFFHAAGGPAATLELYRKMRKDDVPPFGRVDQQHDSSDLWNEATKELLQMIRLCLVRNPDDRPKADMLLKFPLLLDRNKMAQQAEIVTEQHRARGRRSGLPSSFNFSVDSKVKPSQMASQKPPTPAFPSKGIPSPKLTPRVGFAPVGPLEPERPEPAWNRAAPFDVPSSSLGFAVYPSSPPDAESH